MAPTITIARIDSSAARKIAAAFVDANHSYIRWSDRPSRKLYWEIREADQIVGVFGLGSAFAWPKPIKSWMETYGVAFNELANNIVFCLAGHTNRNAGTIALALLRRDAVKWWRERYGDTLRGMQTFILPPRTGAVYKADNWMCLGITSGQSSKVETLTAEEYAVTEDTRGIEARTFKSGAVRYLRRRGNSVEQKLIFVKAISVQRKGDNVIKRIESNVKAGCQVDVGQKTLIVGPNRSGKSTIVNAAELATTGRASDIAGRETLALDAELWTLAPPSVPSVFARVFYEGGQVSWSLEKGKRATRGATPAPAPEYAFPLRAVRENLTASSAKARAWLLGLVAAEVEWSAVLSKIAPALHERVTTLAGGTILGLPTALDTAKRQEREATKRAATFREVVATPIVHAPAPPDAAPFEAEVRKAEAALTQAKAALDALPVADTALADIGAKMVAVLKGQIAAKSATCGICGATGEATRFAARLATIEARIRDVSAVAGTREAAQHTVNDARVRFVTAQSALRTVQQTTAAVESAVTSTQTAAAQSREAEAVEADRAAAGWRELAEAIGRVMASIVAEARGAFEEKVQRFMPAGMTFGLDLLDGDREVCRFGLRDTAGLRSALSGAEWAIVTVALAAAVTPAGVNAIIVPEERAFDPETLAAALMAFDVGPAQVIVTSPIMPSSVPAGWTVIRCGGEIAASAPMPAATPGAGQAPPAPPTPVKRGRGRPRKVPVEAAPAPVPAPAPAPASDVSGLPWA